MDYGNLTDDDLNLLRSEPKAIENPRARELRKAGHLERNYEARSVDAPERKFRIFVRQSVHQSSAFSAGLALCLPAGGTLILARYNGAYHPHRNRIERTSLPVVAHRHIGTRRYLDVGYRIDGFADSDLRYHDVDGALRCLLADCAVRGLSFAPDQSSLDL